ncbi:MAG: 50S ribosomal protein L3 [Vicinamibacterales bacterium]|jgi:large subunit ribosomal protein L3|nr:50S ribosomal protein L3 [Vicinamibacterales bacterium]RUA02631.1 MAG: 50S ribosomal protein L3 [Candidatus Neomarinimicrobiota bacterium]
MVTGILGTKIGMTQLFSADGVVTPATVIKAGPCVVVQRKTVERDGYDAVQLGLVEDSPAKVNKPTAGHYKKANVPPTRIRREVGIAADSDGPAEGEQVVASLFTDGDRVDVIGLSRGKGFQGVMKRHGFSGGGATHGSMFHRAPGSIGASSYPSRVIKGMRGPGRMGGDRVTVRNLRVLQVDAKQHLLIVNGAVPGAPGGLLMVRKAVAAKLQRAPVAEAPKKKKRK